MSNNYEIAGTIKTINEMQAFPSGFQKRSFVITTGEKFPQDIALEFVKEGCARLDSYQEGDGCKVQFNIRGNEYNGRHFVQLAAWKIERTDDGLGVRSPEYGKPDAHNRAKQDGYQPQQRATDQNGAKPPTAGGHSDHDEEDEIPF